MMASIFQIFGKRVKKEVKKRINNRPNVSAGQFPEGYETLGRDNLTWIVSKRSNGSRFWKRVTVATKAPKSTKAPKATKSTKAPRKRSAYNEFVRMEYNNVKAIISSSARGAVIAELGRLWKMLTPSERIVYEKSAKKINSRVAKKTTAKKTTAKKTTAKKTVTKPVSRTEYLRSIRGSHSNLMSGSTLVFTGKLWDTRKNVEEFVTRNGAFVSPNLVKKPHIMLIVGEFGARGPSAKYFEAQKKGIEIVSSDELLEVLTSGF
jgi:hypothetical protein